MNRLSTGRVRIERPQKWPYVRVPDFFLQCVGFVAERIHSPGGDDIYEHEGTGFFVGIDSEVHPGHIYLVFVTAKHVIDRLTGRSIVVIVNKRGGGVTALQDQAGWLFHPTDNSVDVAVLPFNLDPQHDIKSIQTSFFLDRQKMEEEQIGIGDEIFMPGLFSVAVGRSRNMPLLRHGNIAMLPNEPIQVESQFREVYLIEARSIGGISGSPVFVRGTIYVDGIDAKGRETQVQGVSSRHFLLGLAHGHWDIKESEINEPSLIHDRQRGVNYGIGVVVPAHKILEVINHPSLVAGIKASEDELRQSLGPTPDSQT